MLICKSVIAQKSRDIKLQEPDIYIFLIYTPYLMKHYYKVGFIFLIKRNVNSMINEKKFKYENYSLV